MKENTKSDFQIITNQTNENTLSVENLYQYLRTNISTNIKCIIVITMQL